MNGEQIRKLREVLGLSQQELAVKVGVSVSSVHRWESGKTRPHPLAVEKLKALEPAPQPVTH